MSKTYDFFKGVPFSPRNISVADFVSKSARDTFLDKYIAIRELDARAFNTDQTKLLITTVYEALDCNYMRLNDNGAEWFYFITNVSQIEQEEEDANGKTYELTIELDPWQTFYNKLENGIISRPQISGGILKNTNSINFLHEFQSTPLVKADASDKNRFEEIIVDFSPSKKYFPIIIWGTEPLAKDVLDRNLYFAGIVSYSHTDFSTTRPPIVGETVVNKNEDDSYTVLMPALSFERAAAAINRALAFPQFGYFYDEATPKRTVNIKPIKSYIVPAEFLINGDQIVRNISNLRIPNITYLWDDNSVNSDYSPLVLPIGEIFPFNAQFNFEKAIYNYTTNAQKIELEQGYIYSCGSANGSYYELSSVGRINNNNKIEKNIFRRCGWSGFTELSIQVVIDGKPFEISQDYEVPAPYNESGAFIAQTAQSNSIRQIMDKVNIASSGLALIGGIASANPLIIGGGVIGLAQSTGAAAVNDIERAERAATPISYNNAGINNLGRLLWENGKSPAGVYRVKATNYEAVIATLLKFGRDCNIYIPSQTLPDGYYKFSYLETVGGTYPTKISEQFIEYFTRGINIVSNGEFDGTH